MDSHSYPDPLLGKLHGSQDLSSGPGIDQYLLQGKPRILTNHWIHHEGPQEKSRGHPGAITWAPRGNHVGPKGQSHRPRGAITWAPRGNHVGPQGKSRGPLGAITWAPRGNHVGPQGQSRGPPAFPLHKKEKSRSTASFPSTSLHEDATSRSGAAICKNEAKS